MTLQNLSIFILVFLSTFFLANGQTQNLILTKEQNNKWLDSLKVLKLDQQLLSIKNRLSADTNVFVRQFYNDKITVTDSLGNRVYSDGKPTLIIGGYPMIIDNKTKTSKIVSLIKLLTPNNIKKIFILSPNDPVTSALDGNAGQFGIIVMTITKKKNVKQFKRLVLNPNY